jgi:hypothetical protein
LTLQFVEVWNIGYLLVKKAMEAAARRDLRLRDVSTYIPATLNTSNTPLQANTMGIIVSQDAKLSSWDID